LLAAMPLLFAGAFLATVTVGDTKNQPKRSEMPHHDPHGAVLARWLGLSREQLDKIRQADPTFHQEMRRLDREVTIERLKLAQLIESDESDDESIEAQFEKVGQMQVAVHRRLAKHVLAIRPLLDVEQRGRFLDLLARHFRGQGRPDRPGGPGGPGCGPPRPPGPPHGPPPPPGPR
jgi:Spy/CpxP family protein refolding chaperone